MTGGGLPGGGSPQPVLFESSFKDLNSRFRCFQFTRVSFVAGHFGIEEFHPKDLILANLEERLYLINRQFQIEVLHVPLYRFATCGPCITYHDRLRFINAYPKMQDPQRPVGVPGLQGSQSR